MTVTVVVFVFLLEITGQLPYRRGDHIEHFHPCRCVVRHGSAAMVMGIVMRVVGIFVMGMRMGRFKYG